ncbi:hypothetical protein M407DRAFT_152805 [Tulasnella calospora MUT 4182]|uniref:Ribosomal lysine N-methyltransferase 4 n=1 Tax=Tulasnella calospora MUT 4182 TaxID=1051891 RepID=A0A0C3LC30_9AGAM|nr:hypothetical protein M407DRAFT_152805 [Tulasnella calospora MUT 4182]
MGDNAFLNWFERRGGTYAKDLIGLQDFPDTGRGAVALKDIDEDETLFEIPRDLVLSTRTSELPGLLEKEDWESLGSGWASLIVCMMWEEAKGPEGKWGDYFASMPTAFTTLMFWSDEELAQLKGSTILKKIGKSEVEADYLEKALPLITRRPDLFPPAVIAEQYSLERYHINGSRILSRSFHVENWTGKDENQESDEGSEGPDEMDVDDSKASDDEDEEREDTADVGMTPFADMLNARHGCNNARLFYEEQMLKMISTKRILRGEQIWNTYGDPPNADLIRRYGYVDFVPTEDGGLGNPSDVVEICADIAVKLVDAGELEQRVDFFLEEGGDDVFVIEAGDDTLPEDLIVFLRLLLLSPSEWRKAREKESLPKPKPDVESLKLAGRVLEERMKEYPTTIEDDEALLQQDIPRNLRNAVIVRLGEKKILRKAVRVVDASLEELAHKGGKDKKRKRGNKKEDGAGKKLRR